MSDFADAPKTGDFWRDAAAQIIRRIQHDPDLAYLIGPGTESHERLVQAMHSMNWCTVEEARARLRYTGDREPRVLELEERVQRLRAVIDQYEERARHAGEPLVCRDCAGEGDVDGVTCTDCDGSGECAS